MDMIELVSTHLLGLVVGAVGMWLQERWRRRRRDDETRGRAVAEIAAQVRSLRAVVTRTRDVAVETTELIERWRECADAIAEHEHRLPRPWVHLRRSMRAALGELYGGLSWADLSHGDERQEVVPFDHRWWDHAVTYFDYVARRLAEVADRPETAEEAELLDFDVWLSVTGRHGMRTRRSRRWFTCTAARTG